MGKPAVLVSVEKQPNVDTIALTGRIEQALTELGPSLPLGIKADQIVFRQANFIEASIRNLRSVLIEAAVVVAAILFAFLLNWRTTAISLTAIPVSILATAVIFYFAGLSINTMTLGGIAIAIGALVDDAVVNVENIFRRLRENRAAGDLRSTFDVVAAASQEVRSGILYATAIIVLVFVPLFALSGIEGRLFTPLGQAYIIAMLASLLVSITLTPVMAYYMLPSLKQLNEREGGLGPRSQGVYSGALEHALENGWAFIATTVAAVAIAGTAALFLPRAFLPPFNEGTLNIQLMFNPGVSLTESARVGQIAERLMLEVPEVKSIGRRTGRAELDEHAEGIHTNEFEVDLKPSSRTKDEIVADIRSRLTCFRCRSTSASRSRTGSITCCPACAPTSRSRYSATIWMRCAIRRKNCGASSGTYARASPIFRWRSRSSIPQIEIRVDHRRAALYGVQPGAVVDRLSRLSERPRGVARGRRLPQLRRRAAAARSCFAPRSGLATF